MSSGPVTIVLSVNASAISSAPKFDPAMIASGSSSSNPFASVDQFWASNGLTIPATGGAAAPAMSKPVVLRGTMGTVNVTGTGGSSLGQVRDFVVNMMTGQLVYAILSGGNMGSSYVVVPMAQLQYTAGSSNTTLGSFSTTVASSVFQSAPTVTSLDQLNLSQSGWNTQYDQYWNSQK